VRGGRGGCSAGQKSALRRLCTVAPGVRPGGLVEGRGRLHGAYHGAAFTVRQLAELRRGASTGNSMRQWQWQQRQQQRPAADLAVVQGLDHAAVVPVLDDVVGAIVDLDLQRVRRGAARRSAARRQGRWQ
jgi:hypothetical protein